MNTIEHFGITACWGPRLEDFCAVKERVGNVLTRLSKIGEPTFHTWYQKHGEIISKVEYLNEMKFAEAIRASKQDHVNLGYRPFFRTVEGDRGPRTFSFGISVGCLHDHFISLATEALEGVDPALLTFDIHRAATLALAESFDAERAYAFPSALAAHWKPEHNANPAFPLAWISYVGRRATHLVTAPPTAIVERRLDGGLLMAATKETFDVDNPAHMAVARDIEAAVALLHCHPWLTESLSPMMPSERLDAGSS